VAKKSDDGAPRKKVVASRDDEDAEVEATPSRSRDAGMALSPGERALDAVVGMSLSVRRLAFNSRADLPLKPPGYKGSLVPGAMFDVTAYPLAFAHDRKDMLKNLGLRVAYDRVLLINTKDKLGVTYATAESRWAIDAVFRYPFGKAATAPVAVGSLGYSSQKFTISAGGGMLDFPNVQYSIIEPGVGLRLPVGKLVINADAKLMVITNTGQIQDPAQYGAASVFGFEGAAGADYAITPNIFARAAFRFETIGFTFKGAGAMTTMRDGDGATVDVTGARDTYFGGLVTVGYLY